ncbi:MAG: response regulator transcription factor [Gallionella sp.]
MQSGTIKKSKIIIVDDHPMVREGMSMLINCEPDMQSCCKVDQIESALQANRDCPHDLAIVDMTLDGFTGLEMMRRFQLEFPELPILVLSMHAETIYAEPVLKAGGRGYLMKQTATGELLKAIRQVLAGGRYISEDMRARMLQKTGNGKSDDSSIGSLTPSELEVLHLVGMGLGTGEIAEQLARSVKTIEAHKANIKRKLELENSKQLTLFAVNLVTLGKL